MTRLELTTYLDSLEINSDNIGDVRRQLMMPFDCEWNAWVRDETAARENAPWLKSDTSAENKRLREELSHVQRARDTARGLYDAAAKERDHYKTLFHSFKVGDLAKEKGHYMDVAQKALDKSIQLEEQLDAVKIERDSAESRATALRDELICAHTATRTLDKRATHLAKKCTEISVIRDKLALDVLSLHRQMDRLDTRADNQPGHGVQLPPGDVIDAFFKREIEWHNGFNTFHVGTQSWVKSLITEILQFLPQLDVPNHHPVGASTPGNRNPHDSQKERSGKSENGQTSIASEVIPGSSVPGLPA